MTPKLTSKQFLCRHEAVRTGKVSISFLDNNTLVQDCFMRLGDWRLEIWQTVTQYRRGLEPWRTVRLGTGKTRLLINKD